MQSGRQTGVLETCASPRVRRHADSTRFQKKLSAVALNGKIEPPSESSTRECTRDLTLHADGGPLTERFVIVPSLRP